MTLTWLPDWDLLYSIVSPREIITWFPGRFSSNIEEQNPIYSYFHDEGFDFMIFLSGLFKDAHVRGDGLAYDAWLCMSCFKERVRLHLCSWWVKHRRQRE